MYSCNPFGCCQHVFIQSYHYSPHGDNNSPPNKADQVCSISTIASILHILLLIFSDAI